jgi:hypothetical protein
MGIKEEISIWKRNKNKKELRTALLVDTKLVIEVLSGRIDSTAELEVWNEELSRKAAGKDKDSHSKGLSSDNQEPCGITHAQIYTEVIKEY